MWGIMERRNWSAKELEQMARDGETVAGQDLGGINLRDADLDGITFTHCHLGGADLRGCNLSDAVIRQCDLSHVDAVDISLSDSLLKQCNFSHARFGASIVVNARFRSCRFSGPSAFTLDWGAAAQMDHLTYVDEQEAAMLFHEPPLVFFGHSGWLARASGQMVINNTIISRKFAAFPEQIGMTHDLEMLLRAVQQG